MCWRCFPLWESEEEARAQVLYGLEHCDILKISDNEIQWLTGETDYSKGVEWIQKRYRLHYHHQKRRTAGDAKRAGNPCVISGYYGIDFTLRM